MAKKIAATLNLTQALEDFHSTVVQLLEIGVVPANWVDIKKVSV